MFKKEFSTLATFFLTANRVSFNFIEWSSSGQIPTDYHFSIPIYGESVEPDTLIQKVLQTAEEEFKWEFLTDGVLFQPSTRAGHGVDRLDIVLEKYKKDLFLEIDAEKYILNEDLMWKSLVGYMNSRGIDEFLFIEANASSIVLWSLQRGDKDIYKISSSKEEDLEQIRVSNIKVDWKNIENKTKEETLKGVKRFLTTSIPDKDLKNIWANMMFTPKLKYESVVAQDILRADLMSTLQSIKESAGNSLRDFGARPERRAAILCTGDFAVSLSSKHLLLGIIDGLGLYGNVQIVVDTKDLFSSLSVVNSEYEGMYSQDLNKLLQETVYTLVSAKPVGVGANDEVVLIGELSNEEGNRTIYGLRNRIQNHYLEQSSTLKINPVKVDDIGGADGPLVHKGIVGNLVLDTRDHKHITYGPGPRENANKVHLWLNDLSHG